MQVFFAWINFLYLLMIRKNESTGKISKLFIRENEFTRKLGPFVSFIYNLFYTFLNTCIATSLLNCVPCVLKTCSHANMLCVLTCHSVLRAHVPCVLPCSRANVPCVLMYSRVNVACELTCSRANRP